MYDKQDCEAKAFKRLALKLKLHFPYLSICILADALYTTGLFFQLCKANQWSFIVVFKDTQLKTVWEQLEQQSSEEEQAKEKLSGTTTTYKSFKWVNGLNYQSLSLNRMEANMEDQKTTSQGY